MLLPGWAAAKLPQPTQDFYDNNFCTNSNISDSGNRDHS